MKKIIAIIIEPFKWLWKNLRDWQTWVIFIITALIVGSEVWVCYLLAIIFAGTPFAVTMASVASASLFFWNCIPCTPFIGICIVITMFIKFLFNKKKSNKTFKEYFKENIGKDIKDILKEEKEKK